MRIYFIVMGHVWAAAAVAMGYLVEMLHAYRREGDAFGFLVLACLAVLCAARCWDIAGTHKRRKKPRQKR